MHGGRNQKHVGGEGDSKWTKERRRRREEAEQQRQREEEREEVCHLQ